MKGRRGLRPALAAGAGALAALIAGAWLLGLWPSFGAAHAPALPPGPAPAWVNRLGLIDLPPGASPNPLVEDRLGQAGDTPAGAALRADLCAGRDMDADHAFRRMRAALLANNPSICPSPLERLQARAPLAVALGPTVGFPLTLGLVALLALVGLVRVAGAKRNYDRWRLLGRSTFGKPRGAGSG